MLKFKHGEQNLACTRAMCSIYQQVKMQQMRCLTYGPPVLALVIYLDYMNLRGIAVFLDFGTSVAVKTYSLQ